MKVKDGDKHKGVKSAVIGAFAGICIQLLLTVAAASLIISGTLTEGRWEQAAWIIRMITIFAATYIAGKIGGENKLLGAILTAVVMLTVWFVTALILPTGIHAAVLWDVLLCVVSAILAILLIMCNKTRGRRGYKKGVYR